MRAAVFHDVEDIRIEEVPDPTPGHGDVIVEVSACGICGSDLEYYTGRSPLGTASGSGPLILGHEFSGRVVALGPGVTTLREGDRVAVNPIQSNPGLDASRSGRPNFDLDNVLGVSIDGGFARFVRSRAEHAHRLPDELTDQHGAFVEMMAASLHAVEKAEIQYGDLVLIFGPGPVGLSMVGLAAARGAAVAMVGTRDYRLELAKQLGAHHVFNVSDTSSPYYAPDLIEAVRAVNHGELAQRSLVATSVVSANQDALGAIGPGGTAVYMGLAGPDDTLSVPLLDTLVQEKQIRFSWLYPNQWPKTIRLMQKGLIDIDPLITHEIALPDLAQGIEQLGAREDGVIKMMVRPS